MRRKYITITANNWIGWTTASSGSHKLTTFVNNATADRVAISVNGDGDYEVIITTDASISSQNQDHYVGVFKNGVLINHMTKFLRHGANNNWENLCGILTDLVAGDYLDLRFSAPQNRIVNIRCTSMKVIRI